MVVYDTVEKYFFETESWAHIWIDFENLSLIYVDPLKEK